MHQPTIEELQQRKIEAVLEPKTRADVNNYIGRALQANDEVARIALIKAAAKVLGLSITPVGMEIEEANKAFKDAEE
jgi:hypothetical protein